MLELSFGENRLPALAGETVLETMERHRQPIASSCRAGVCQSCLLRATEGTPPPASQVGLKDSQKEQGYFLACLCRPTEPLTFDVPTAAMVRGEVTIESITPIGPDVIAVRLHHPKGFAFRAGQFVTLTRSDGLARSYSIASLPAEDGTFEIHVRHVPNGRMSSWWHSEARPGVALTASEAKGDCYYASQDPKEPLTLVGTGTGVAPLAAIVADALDRGHCGPITLYQGAGHAARLYLTETLSGLAARHSNFRYVRCARAGEAPDGIVVGELDKIALAGLQEAKRHKVYLCGDPDLVNKLRKRFFLAGVGMRQIFADPFV